MNEEGYVAIIDYGMGNLFSVEHVCRHVGLTPMVTSDPFVIMNSNAVILPGVGAFGDAMNNLEALDLIVPIKEFIAMGKPFIGICLGMQLLFSESEEFGIHKGLNIFDGTVIKFPLLNDKGNKVKVPNIGWNRIYRPSTVEQGYWDNTLLKNIKNGEFMYFVHSYYPIPNNPEVVLIISEYEDIVYCSGVLWRNICAFQFHPEKSAMDGIKIYNNLAVMIKSRKEGGLNE